MIRSLGRWTAPSRWIRFIGLYLMAGSLMLTFQAWSMSGERWMVLVFGLVFSAAIYGLHLWLARGLERDTLGARIFLWAYALVLMAPQLTRTLTLQARAWDVFAMAMIGWALLAVDWAEARCKFSQRASPG